MRQDAASRPWRRYLPRRHAAGAASDWERRRAVGGRCRDRACGVRTGGASGQPVASVGALGSEARPGPALRARCGRPAARQRGAGAGVSSPAALFLTVHGTTAVLTDAVTGTARSPAPSVSIDLHRRQIDVRVPHAAWDPGRSTVRMEAGVGLWDAGAGTYLKPGPT